MTEDMSAEKRVTWVELFFDLVLVGLNTVEYARVEHLGWRALLAHSAAVGH
jgi:hypothetical protein